MGVRLRAAPLVAALGACAPGLTIPERGAVGIISGGLMAGYQAVRMGDRLLELETPMDEAWSNLELAAAMEARAAAELPACGSVARDGANVTIAFGPWPGCSLADGSRAVGTLVGKAVRTASYPQLDLVYGKAVLGDRMLDGTLRFVPLGPRWMVFNEFFADDVQVTFGGVVLGRSGTLTLDNALSVFRSGGDPDAGLSQYRSDLYSVEWADGDCYPRSGRVEISRPVQVTVTFSGGTPATGRANAAGEQGRTEVELPRSRNCPPDR